MPQKFYPFKAFGTEFQLPVLAVYALSVIVVLGVGWGVYQQVYAQPEKVILSLKDVNQRLAAEVEEYGLHVMEEPTKHELFEDTDGRLVLRVYKDHCVMIQRQTPRGIRSKLIVDLARGALVSRQGPSPPATWGLATPLLAQPACNRGCLNPHPGGFRWWYGKQFPTGWVEVWRQWPDGCTHVQLFHPQAGTWDTNPDGTPRVKWSCCTH